MAKKFCSVQNLVMVFSMAMTIFMVMTTVKFRIIGICYDYGFNGFKYWLFDGQGKKVLQY